MADTRRHFSTAQRRTLEALVVDEAPITPNTSTICPVKVGPHVLTLVRWATIRALMKSGYLAHAERPGAYCITDVGRAALADGKKASEMGGGSTNSGEGANSSRR